MAWVVSFMPMETSILADGLKIEHQARKFTILHVEPNLRDHEKRISNMVMDRKLGLMKSKKG